MTELLIMGLFGIAALAAYWRGFNNGWDRGYEVGKDYVVWCEESGLDYKTGERLEEED